MNMNIYIYPNLMTYFSILFNCVRHNQIIDYVFRLRLHLMIVFNRLVYKMSHDFIEVTSSNCLFCPKSQR